MHGIHALLWCLERWASLLPARGRIVSVEARFRQAIRLGEPVACEGQVVRPGALELRATSDGRRVIDALCHTAAEDTPLVAPQPWPPITREPCRERSFEDASRARGVLAVGFDESAFSERFPALTGRLPAGQLAAIVSCSRLAGMHCPGLRSILISLQLAFDHPGDPAPELEYSAVSADPRFSTIRLELHGSHLAGELRVAVRPAPVEQPAVAALAPRVQTGEFEGVRALVVGGSQGLGEVTAKLLGAGGADVRLTFCRGEADAQRIVDDLARAGRASSAFRLDVLQEELGLDELAGWPPTHLFYFPTPFVSLNESTEFSARLFRRYAAFYVEGFARTLKAVLELRPPQLDVFYPSTAALDDILPKAAEYAVAKAAGEALCAHLARQHRHVRVHVVRLPRTLTDRTVSLLSGDAADPVTVLLPLLRRVCPSPSEPAEAQSSRRT